MASRTVPVSRPRMSKGLLFAHVTRSLQARCARADVCALRSGGTLMTCSFVTLDAHEPSAQQALRNGVMHSGAVWHVVSREHIHAAETCGQVSLQAAGVWSLLRLLLCVDRQ